MPTILRFVDTWLCVGTDQEWLSDSHSDSPKRLYLNLALSLASGRYRSRFHTEILLSSVQNKSGASPASHILKPLLLLERRRAGHDLDDLSSNGSLADAIHVQGERRD